MRILFEAFHQFWRQHPALLYGAALFISTFAGLSDSPLLLLPALALIVPLLAFKKEGQCIRCLLTAILMVSDFVWIKSTYSAIELPKGGMMGEAEIVISSFCSHATSFGKRWGYKGMIQTFYPQNDKENPLHHLPFCLSLPQAEGITPPPATCSYRVFGRLKEIAPKRYCLQVKKEALWYPLERTWSLAAYRFQAKRAVGDYLKEQISHPQAAAFLTGISTGDFDDPAMQHAFGRFGLQHIMAISGFHFAIMAGVCSLLLRLLMGQRKAFLLLMTVLTSYFAFLGWGPSVVRAWVMCLIGLGGYLLERQGSALNSLGVALLGILLWDPFAVFHLGFQFSFLTTAAILLFYTPCDQAWQRLFPKRSLSEMVEMNGCNQHAYCFLALCRQGLALTCAVNSVALPLMLFYFHKFPLLSLLYNLFFPFLVSISMLLLIIGLLLGFLPPLSSFIHGLNSYFTQFILRFTEDLPTRLDVIWRSSSVSLEILVVYLCLLFTIGVLLKYRLRQQAFEETLFV
jgi:competence protein ComEC